MSGMGLTYHTMQLLCWCSIWSVCSHAKTHFNFKRNNISNSSHILRYVLFKTPITSNENLSKIGVEICKKKNVIFWGYKINLFLLQLLIGSAGTSCHTHVSIIQYGQIWLAPKGKCHLCKIITQHNMSDVTFLFSYMVLCWFIHLVHCFLQIAYLLKLNHK